jgi:hypothetical protein
VPRCTQKTRQPGAALKRIHVVLYWSASYSPGYARHMFGCWQMTFHSINYVRLATTILSNHIANCWGLGVKNMYVKGCLQFESKRVSKHMALPGTFSKQGVAAPIMHLFQKLCKFKYSRRSAMQGWTEFAYVHHASKHIFLLVHESTCMRWVVMAFATASFGLPCVTVLKQILGTRLRSTAQ